MWFYCGHAPSTWNIKRQMKLIKLLVPTPRHILLNSNNKKARLFLPALHLENTLMPSEVFPNFFSTIIINKKNAHLESAYFGRYSAK